MRASFGGIISSKEVFKMASYHLRLKNDRKPNGAKVSAKAHADYILREGENSQKSDCVFQGHQLPSWADESAQKFFSAADRYEDKGNRRYKEIEFSLPNELTLEQNREIVDRFIACHLTNHYYAYAIHEKSGAISGERHPHVHIMFSERLIDDVEKIKERPAYKYFTRAAKPLKGEKEASFERRREHGAPKDKKWHSKKFLFKIREDYARIQNEVLSKYGFSIRVDHRTLKVQKAEAEEHGDKFLAGIFDRIPETYVGITSAHSTNENVVEVKKYRASCQQKQSDLFQSDLQEKIAFEFAVKEVMRRAEMDALLLVQSENFKMTDFENESLRILKQNILTELEKNRNLKRKFSTCRQAVEKAQTEYLTSAEQKALGRFKNFAAQKFNLVMLLKELRQPSDKQSENLKAYNEIKSCINEKILSLENSMADLKADLKNTDEKFREAYCRKNIQFATHNILQRNLEILNELKETSEKLFCNVREFKNLSDKKEQPKIIFTLAEVEENLRQQCRSLKVEYEKSVDKKNELMWKVINPTRAMSMAKNIFVRGEFKKLREENRKYEKAVAELGKKISEHRQRELNFQNAKFETMAEKIQEQYYLTKEKIAFESEQQKLQSTKNFLVGESDRLEKICQTDEARQKISLIAAGILKKNLRIVNEYENEKIRSKDLFQKLRFAKNRLEQLKENCPQKLKNKFFRVFYPDNAVVKNSPADKNSIAAIIADALSGEKNAVQLVAYSSSGTLEMEKSWNLMSELDKDELIHKKIMREL